MDERTGIVIQIPDRQHALLFLKLTALLTLEFLVVYGGINWLTQWRSDVHHLYFDWELEIPLIPATLWIYASIVVLMLLPLFMLRTDQLRGLARQMALAMLIAGTVFLLFPGQTGYPTPAELPGGISQLRSIDFPFNVFPSLHVALSAIILLFLQRSVGTPMRVFFAVWFLAINLSVILTHQHHIADIAGALVLVWVCHLVRPQDIS